MITTTTSATENVIAPWRHVRAIALLPLMNTVIIPGILLALTPATPPYSMRGLAIAVATVGTMLLAGGAVLVAHCIRLFIRLGRGTLAPWDPTRELVSVGAYRYSRNPMKGGLFLVLAGEAVLTGSSALAVWAVSFALVNVLYIRLHEEPGLYARFGAPYRDYCARVPRWWPTLASLRAAIH